MSLSNFENTFLNICLTNNVDIIRDITHFMAIYDIKYPYNIILKNGCINCSLLTWLMYNDCFDIFSLLVNNGYNTNLGEYSFHTYSGGNEARTFYQSSKLTPHILENMIYNGFDINGGNIYGQSFGHIFFSRNLFDFIFSYKGVKEYLAIVSLLFKRKMNMCGVYDKCGLTPYTVLCRTVINASNIFRTLRNRDIFYNFIHKLQILYTTAYGTDNLMNFDCTFTYIDVDTIEKNIECKIFSTYGIESNIYIYTGYKTGCETLVNFIVTKITNNNSNHSLFGLRISRI